MFIFSGCWDDDDISDREKLIELGQLFSGDDSRYISFYDDKRSGNRAQFGHKNVSGEWVTFVSKSWNINTNGYLELKNLYIREDATSPENKISDEEWYYEYKISKGSKKVELIYKTNWVSDYDEAARSYAGSYYVR